MNEIARSLEYVRIVYSSALCRLLLRFSRLGYAISCVTVESWSVESVSQLGNAVRIGWTWDACTRIVRSADERTSRFLLTRLRDVRERRKDGEGGRHYTTPLIRNLISSIAWIRKLIRMRAKSGRRCERWAGSQTPREYFGN